MIKYYIYQGDSRTTSSFETTLKIHVLMHMLFNRRSAMDADSTFGIRISNGKRHARIYLSFKQWSEDNNLYRPE